MEYFITGVDTDIGKTFITKGLALAYEHKNNKVGVFKPLQSGAIKSPNDEAADILNKKMAEYALAVVKDRPQFHISLICDVSPNCDCHAENDAPIVPDIGMLASFDMVALDKACADLVNAQTPFTNSHLGEQIEKNIKERDNFHMSHPETHWESQIEHGEEIGLGTSEYELIKV